MSSEDAPLVKWSPGQYPPETYGAEGKCRLSPRCASGGRGPRHPGCPDAPAEFSEKIGADLPEYGPPRYIALCRDEAIRRHDHRQVAKAEAGES